MVFCAHQTTRDYIRAENRPYFLSLSCSAPKSFKTNHNIYTAQLKCITTEDKKEKKRKKEEEEEEKREKKKKKE